MKRLKPFLPCFFDLPLKEVLKILNVSHHTLDPIRRSMGLTKWPCVDILRGKLWNHEEIVALRAQMMPVADTEMQRILCRVATRSQQFWSAPIQRRGKRLDEVENVPCTPIEEEPAQPVEPAEYDEGSFWNDIRDLFGLANHGPALSPDPRVEEYGLFP
jgi:hypothetical protein